VTKTRAQVLGAMTAVILVGGYVMVRHLAPPPCAGATFVELHPPLPAPGIYHISLVLDGGSKRCDFEVPLPSAQPVSLAGCKMRVEITIEGEGAESRITGLAFGAAPKHLGLQVRRGTELVYALEIDPVYSEYPATHEESKRFCGPRARLTPPCIRGSSACLPFRASCDGPEDCPGGQVCCLNPDLGRKYGAKAAVECSSERRCIDRFGMVACHAPEDCPPRMVCAPSSVADFSPLVQACRDR
jgi:hypothetical protein